ncbi:hypothetical protein OG524_17265 [Streptomyces sp. NBC_01520]
MPSMGGLLGAHGLADRLSQDLNAATENLERTHDIAAAVRAGLEQPV